jgi:quercetin dioxygenase-like cupin family protein
MDATHQQTWISGWTAEDPIQIGYTAVGRDEGEWVSSDRPNLETRDLGVADASRGKIGVTHVRRTGTGPVELDWHCHDLDFQLVYLLQGSLTIEDEHGETTLGPGDCVCMPALYRHRESIGDTYEAILITAPARYETIEGRNSALPARAAALDPDRRPVVTYERPESYTVGAGPRRFFAYRDLGTRGPTEDRIHVHIVRAQGEPGAGTGWHYHTMAQWFMILGGNSIIRVEDRPKYELGPLDSMCIGSGEQMRHNVAPFSGDYAVLEMCVPAEYETIPVPPPAGADAPPDGAKE